MLSGTAIQPTGIGLHSLKMRESSYFQKWLQAAARKGDYPAIIVK